MIVGSWSIYIAYPIVDSIIYFWTLNSKQADSDFMKYVDYTFVQSEIFQWPGNLLYNLAVYILVQSDEECSLICKAKPVTI